MKRHKRLRSQKGSLSFLLMLALVSIILSVGALGTDFAHFLQVKNELQNAADAGALAGAQDLWTNPTNCSADALAVTGMNMADGKYVKQTTAGCTVTTKVTLPNQPKTNGSVEVDASLQIHDMLGPMFGRFSDTITVKAVAGSVGKLTEIFDGEGFPLAVSWDAVPNGGTALDTHKVGDSVVFNINSQGNKNAAWTSMTHQPASGNFIKTEISEAIGASTKVAGDIPAVSVGDNIYLNNGNLDPGLSKDPQASDFLNPNSPPLVMPVVLGDPSMNQSRQVVGFIAIKPTAVNKGNGNGIVQTITGTIMTFQALGNSGPQGPNTPSSLYNMQPGPLQLIQ